MSADKQRVPLPDLKGIVGAAFVALMASLATPLYEPLTTGRDDSWLVAATVALAHLALGVAIPRLVVLAAPVAVCLILFGADGGEGLSWLILLFGLPALVVVTGLGAVAGRRLRARRRWAAGGLLALALVAPVMAAAQQVQRATAPHVSPAVQRGLRTDLSFGNLCPDAETDRNVIRELRGAAALLLSELRRNPDHLVAYTYYWADDPPEKKQITVRELAQERLRDLEDSGSNCAPDVGRRLRAAL
jgi:uncharacterized membrane protein YhaH (DUF805 family)